MSDLLLKDEFKSFLIQKGYKQVTPSGHPSTVFDYLKRIQFVCDEERLNWKQLASNISTIRMMYDTNGVKSDLGKISHNAVISALKQYEIFVGTLH